MAERWRCRFQVREPARAAVHISKASAVYELTGSRCAETLAAPVSGGSGAAARASHDDRSPSLIVALRAPRPARSAGLPAGVQNSTWAAGIRVTSDAVGVPVSHK